MAESAEQDDAMNGKNGLIGTAETQGYITVCRDCDYVDAVRAKDAEELNESGEDPAQKHYLETGHTVGSVSVDEFDGDVLSGMIFDE